jgi:hypothetical protein
MPLAAQPGNLAKLVAQRETAASKEREQYLYLQKVTITEYPTRGRGGGQFREQREIIFSPQGERSERVISSSNGLQRLLLTEEDFQDIRGVQPFLFTEETLWMYDVKPRGEETVFETECWVIQVRPRQTLAGQRLFDGMFWVSKSDYSVVKTEGIAVPQIVTRKQENLFPGFLTVRQNVDGHRFPLRTFADDTLHFSSGPIRIRMEIEYHSYKKFHASSSVTFAPVTPP